MPQTKQTNWWKGAIIYQIYPRSFYDTNADGVGDLVGITKKLDYVSQLGVDAIWISPFFKSPMKDFGYDVSDFYDIDPLFGSLKDWDELLQQAHQRNIKILTDMVINHTSDQHAWFIESRRNHDNSKADWYVWENAKPDGSPPNNWLSVFGGSAWAWDETRQQYYLHNFLKSQPDLNYNNSNVVDAALSIMKFWLERGVDGFRLDAVNFYLHDKKLRDNPMRRNDDPPAEGAPASNPYSRQHHVYDKTQPENLKIIEKMRALMDQYPGTTSIGELGDDNSMITAGNYVCNGNRLHMVYSFRLLEGSLDAGFIRNSFETMQQHAPHGWFGWSFSNHDIVRAVTRWGGKNPHPNLGRLLMQLLLTLRGTPCIYQGEELSLPEADVPHDKMQDPYGIEFYPTFKGRDGCRTPIPWQHDAKNAGFTEAKEPWLPIPIEHLEHAVDLQEANKNTLLHHYRRFIHWRKQQPALIHGQINFVDADDNILAFERHTTEQTFLLVFNLSHTKARFTVVNAYKLVETHSFDVTLKKNTMSLLPFGVAILKKI